MHWVLLLQEAGTSGGGGHYALAAHLPGAAQVWELEIAEPLAPQGSSIPPIPKGWKQAQAGGRDLCVVEVELGLESQALCLPTRALLPSHIILALMAGVVTVLHIVQVGFIAGNLP